MKIFAILLLFSMPTLLWADVYYYQDDKGVMHFAEKKLDQRYQLLMRTPSAPKSAPPPSAANNYGSCSFRKQQDGNHTIISATGSCNVGRSQAWQSKRREQWIATIREVAHQYRLEPALLDAVMGVESAYNPNAISRAGAMGLMQLMPATADRFGVKDPFDPMQNIHGGAKYLRWLMDEFNGDKRLVLAGYNAGEGAVRKYNMTIPPYPETQQYVVKVLSHYDKVQQQFH